MNEEFIKLLEQWAARNKPTTGIDSSIYSRVQPNASARNALAMPQPQQRTAPINALATPVQPQGVESIDNMFARGRPEYWDDPAMHAAVEAYKKNPGGAGIVYHDPKTGRMLLDAGGVIPLEGNDLVDRTDWSKVNPDDIVSKPVYREPSQPIDRAGMTRTLQDDTLDYVLKNAPSRIRLR